MSVVDAIGIVLLVLVVGLFAGVIARQRYMLRSPGGIPLATRKLVPRGRGDSGRGGARWLYGVGRYSGDELRWYRAIGIGTRPTRVLRRGDLEVLSRRGPLPDERNSLPASAVVVECRDPTGLIAIALADGAFTGFVSWLEASAPKS